MFLTGYKNEVIESLTTLVSSMKLATVLYPFVLLSNHKGKTDLGLASLQSTGAICPMSDVQSYCNTLKYYNKNKLNALKTLRRYNDLL